MNIAGKNTARKLFVAFAVTGCVVVPAGAEKEVAADDTLLNIRTPTKSDLERLIFSAILEGLCFDGVKNDVVDRILRASPSAERPPSGLEQSRPGFSLHFVYGCPICMPAFNAFRTYRARPKFFGQKFPRDTFGPGLSKEVREGLLNDETNVRLRAIAEVTRSWVDRKLRSLRLSSTEAASLAKLIGAGRKEGMGLLRSNQEKNPSPTAMKACPFCDGSAGACKIPFDSPFLKD